MAFETVIGLEVHAQLKTKTKIFCKCSTQFGGDPNSHTCPVCLGMPGVLPVLNKKVVDFTLKMGLATHCSIAPCSRFARKNYFYPDLPKGYQISQYELPLAEHGHVDIETGERTRRIGITRIHMEEDAGKLVHEPEKPHSRVDYNRTGVPLMEIVSEPDLRSPEEAGAYLKKLRSILRYLDICDGNMEEGSFRCDANVSLRPENTDTLGTRTEIKNLNSFKNVEKALHYEIRRQTERLADGEQIVQETRLWDPDKNRTFSMRGKEEAHDYRYFPDPDLLPLVIDEAWIDSMRNQLPELPDEKKKRFISVLGLTDYDAGVLTSNRELADYFDACVQAHNNPKLAANWIMGSLLGLLNATGIDVTASPVAPAALAELIALIEKGTISEKIAKTVFTEMAETGAAATRIVDAKGLTQVSDTSALETIVAQIIDAHPDEVERCRAGQTKLIGFFVGRVMKETGGKANPKIVNEILRKTLV